MARTVFITSPPPKRDVIRRLSDDHGRRVDRHGRFRPPHAGARRAGRVHFARGPDNRRGVWQVRRGDRGDNIRWSVPHWHCPADRRSHLHGNRLRSECQRQRLNPLAWSRWRWGGGSEFRSRSPPTTSELRCSIEQKHPRISFEAPQYAASASTSKIGTALGSSPGPDRWR